MTSFWLHFSTFTEQILMSCRLHHSYRARGDCRAAPKLRLAIAITLTELLVRCYHRNCHLAVTSSFVCNINQTVTIVWWYGLLTPLETSRKPATDVLSFKLALFDAAKRLNLDATRDLPTKIYQTLSDCLVSPGLRIVPKECWINLNRAKIAAWVDATLLRYV